MNLLIGIIASAIIFYQTQYISTSFGWALIHGAGVSSFLTLWPVLLAIGFLWGGWIFIKDKTKTYRTVFSFVFSVVIIIVVEIMLPGTPLKAYLQQQAIHRVEVQDVSDQVLLSAKGNPIGIRLTYKVTFPREDIYTTSPAQYAPLNAEPELYPLQFGHFLDTTVEPEPSKVEGRPGERFFKAHIPYRFVFDSTPNFLHYDKSSNTYCVYLQPNKNYSASDVKSSIDNADKVQYKTFIQLHGSTPLTNTGFTREYVTQNKYNVKEIYNSAIREGASACPF